MNLKINGGNFLLILVLITFINVPAIAQEESRTFNKYSPEDLYEDLDFLVQKCEQIHPEFFRETSKDTLLARIADLKKQINPPISRIDFVNLFSPVILNTIKDGHTYINSPEEEFNLYLEKGGRVFPIPVTIYERKLYCNSTTAEIPFKSEITSINQTPSREIIEKILSGYNAENDRIEELINSDWFSSLYWFNYGGFSKYEIEYLDDEKIVQQKVVSPGRTLEEIDLKRFNKKEKPYFFQELDALKTGVMVFNSHQEMSKFKPFCDSVFSLIKDKKYSNLIIDLRNNTGGYNKMNDILLEYLISEPFNHFQSIEVKISKDKKKSFIERRKSDSGWFRWYHYLYYPVYIRANEKRKLILGAKNGTLVNESSVPEIRKENALRFEGKVYVLTGRKTYSAAAALAAVIKCYKLGTIVGQETGQPTEFYADGVEVILPNTKISCTISSKKFKLPCNNGDGKGVLPDHSVNNNQNETQVTDFEMQYVQSLITTN